MKTPKPPKSNTPQSKNHSIDSPNNPINHKINSEDISYLIDLIQKSQLNNSILELFDFYQDSLADSPQLSKILIDTIGALPEPARSQHLTLINTLFRQANDQWSQATLATTTSKQRRTIQTKAQLLYNYTSASDRHLQALRLQQQLQPQPHSQPSSKQSLPSKPDPRQIQHEEEQKATPSELIEKIPLSSSTAANAIPPPSGQCPTSLPSSPTARCLLQAKPALPQPKPISARDHTASTETASQRAPPKQWKWRRKKEKTRSAIVSRASASPGHSLPRSSEDGRPRSPTLCRKSVPREQ